MEQPLSPAQFSGHVRIQPSLNVNIPRTRFRLNRRAAPVDRPAHMVFVGGTMRSHGERRIRLHRPRSRLRIQREMGIVAQPQRDSPEPVSSFHGAVGCPLISSVPEPVSAFTAPCTFSSLISPEPVPATTSPADPSWREFPPTPSAAW